jgi:hypothetical protein
MEEPVTTFGESTETWLVFFFGPILQLFELLWSFVSWLWS